MGRGHLRQRQLGMRHGGTAGEAKGKCICIEWGVISDQWSCVECKMRNIIERDRVRSKNMTSRPCTVASLAGGCGGSVIVLGDASVPPKPHVPRNVRSPPQRKAAK